MSHTKIESFQEVIHGKMDQVFATV